MFKMLGVELAKCFFLGAKWAVDGGGEVETGPQPEIEASGQVT